MKKIISLMLICIVLFTSCVTSTMVTFKANTDGANVYIDDELVGQTPVKVKMSNFVLEEPNILIEKDGYKDARGQVKKEVKIINLVSGFLFVWIPWLWVYGPKGTQTFQLQEGQ